MPAFIDLTDQTFGRLVVVRRIDRRVGGRNIVWLCRCECGAEPEVAATHLRTGHTRSCGCLQSEAASRATTTHGATRARAISPEFRSWSAAKNRCFNPRCTHYADYGGRGITMCKRWANSFAAFLSDMGPRPTGTSLDRIDNNGNYEPGNCRWATQVQQRANQRPAKPRPSRYVPDTERGGLRGVAARAGVNYDTLRKRLADGVPLERAVIQGRIRRV